MFLLPFSQRAPRAPVLPKASEMHLARRTLDYIPTKSRLPGEGVVYDEITLSNFVDMDKYNLTATLSKSIPVSTLSTLLDADLPTKVAITGKLGTLGVEGFKVNPMARASLSVRLLDLSSDSRQKGFFRFKASARTDGRRDHGFELDRRIELFSLPNTTLYGNVLYKTSTKSNGAWKTISSFGLHQDFRMAGIKFSGRIGLTPEGQFVYDLKL